MGAHICTAPSHTTVFPSPSIAASPNLELRHSSRRDSVLRAYLYGGPGVFESDCVIPERRRPPGGRLFVRRLDSEVLRQTPDLVHASDVVDNSHLSRTKDAFGYRTRERRMGPGDLYALS